MSITLKDVNEQISDTADTVVLLTKQLVRLTQMVAELSQPEPESELEWVRCLRVERLSENPTRPYGLMRIHCPAKGCDCFEDLDVFVLTGQVPVHCHECGMVYHAKKEGDKYFWKGATRE